MLVTTSLCKTRTAISRTTQISSRPHTNTICSEGEWPGSLPGVELLRKLLLVRVWPGDRPCVRPCGGIGAQVDPREGCPTPGGVGECSGAAGHGESTRGSDHTLVLRSLKLPTAGKEHTVLSVGADQDTGGAKVSLMILYARRRPREVSQVRCVARKAKVQLRQPARKMRHAREHCRAGDGERHLIVRSGDSVATSIRRVSKRSERSEKQHERYYANRAGKNRL